MLTYAGRVVRRLMVGKSKEKLILSPSKSVKFFNTVAEPVSLEKEVMDEKFREKDQELRQHRANHHPLFNYLESLHDKGLNSEQYLVYRDNFFYRTHNTIPSVAKVVIAAAKQADYETLAEIGKNLFQETGEGEPKNVHLKLLVDSHNLHGKLFDLPPLQLKEAEQSQYILPETREFIKTQNELYESPIYHIVLGASYAHETAADEMLRKFQKSIFSIYTGQYTKEDYEELSKYFDAHLNGVELDHGNKAKLAIRRLCLTENDIALIFEGAKSFLDAQANLWDGMHAKMLEMQNKPIIVKPSPSKSRPSQGSNGRNNLINSIIKMFKELIEDIKTGKMDVRLRLAVMGFIISTIGYLINFSLNQYSKYQEDNKQKINELNEAILSDAMIGEIESILNNVVDVNFSDFKGRFPIILAVEKRNLELVELLLNRNEISANVDVINGNNETLAHVICKNARITQHFEGLQDIECKLLKRLIERSSIKAEIILKNNKSNANSIYEAAANGKLHILAFLAEKYPNEFRIGIKQVAKNGWTPLTTSMKHVLDRSNNLEYRKNHLSATKFILAHITNLDSGYLNQLADKKSTALRMAVKLNDEELVRELLEKGADPKLHCNNSFFTPLHIAAKNENICIVNMLLEKGADPNIQKQSLLTPLHIAAYQGRLDIVKLMMKYGADPRIQNDHSKPVPIRARESGQYEVADYLEDQIAKLNLQNNSLPGFFKQAQSEEDIETVDSNFSSHCNVPFKAGTP